MMVEKKSLLIVSESFLSGGLETHIAGEVRHLSNLGFDAHVAVGRNYRRDGVPGNCKSVTTDIVFGPEATAADLVQAVDSLVGLVREHSIQYIHCHPFGCFFPAYLASQEAGVPFIFSVHSPASLEVVFGPLYEVLLYGLVLPNASLVCCVSGETLSLARAYVPDERCVLLPNGVDVELFAPAGGASCERWAIVSRLDSLKVDGIKRFLQVAHEAGMSGGFDIIGDGPSASDLEAFVNGNESLAMKVSLKGFHPAVWEVLGDYAGVAGMGRVVLEGLATGRPTVLVGYDGPKGLLDDELIAIASGWNFSGRGVPTIGPEQLHGQMNNLRAAPQRFDLRHWVEDFRNEATIWTEFARVIQNASPKSSCLATELFHLLKTEAGRPGPYFSDPKLFTTLGRFLVSSRYHDTLTKKVYDYMQITRLNQVLTERDGRTQELAREVGRLDAHAQVLAREVAEKDSHAQELAREVRRLDAHAQALAREVAEKDSHAQELAQEVRRLDAHAQALAREVAGKDAHAQALAREVAGKDSHMQQLAQEVARLNEQLQLERNKTLWQRLIKRLKK
jgi:glycosyltransferase involved in cell wall biosynthesis